MLAFLTDEALGTRLTVEELNALPSKSSRLPKGLRYEVPADLPPKRGPVARGPAAGIIGGQPHA